MQKTVLAIGCHPDDIEFMMSGTLMLLGKTGYELHYLNVANGLCGTDRLPAEEIIRIRREESLAAARFCGAVYHESMANDIEVFYTKELLARVGAVIRTVKPGIILTHSPEEYMEDHSTTCRLVVTAAFCRGMTNFQTQPAVAKSGEAVTLYHAMPYGLCTQLRQPIIPELFVDISSEIASKKAMLSCHTSQKEWLDVSQGKNSYLTTLEELGRDVGTLSGIYPFAEGWRRHSHLGFCAKTDDPLSTALVGHVIRNPTASTERTSPSAAHAPKAVKS